MDNLTIAADVAAKKLKDNRDNGSPLSFSDIVAEQSQKFAVPYHNLQMELSRRSAEKRRNLAVKKTKVL